MGKPGKQNGTPAQTSTPIPEQPGGTLFLWLGIIGAASGSLFFNLYNDSQTLPAVIAGAAGFLPPFMSVVLGHAVKDVEEGWAKVGVFVVTIGAMSVSARGSAEVLSPALGVWGGYLLSVVLDGADLILLYALIKHYGKARHYKQWLATEGAGTSLAPVLATAPAGSEPVARVVPNHTPEPVPAQSEPVAPVPSSGSGLPVPVAAKATAPAKHPRTQSRTATTAEDRQSLRAAVVTEMAARPRPAMEHAAQRVARAESLLTEYQQRTGIKMSLAELGKALGVSKATAGEIRSAITEPEGERAGEQDREGEETA